MTKLAPPPQHELNTRRLPTSQIEVGSTLVRIHRPGQALFFGPGPGQRPRGRFDSLDGEFATCYMAENTLAAFAETFLREGRVKLVMEGELAVRWWSRLQVVAPLTLVSCHGSALTTLQTTSAISSGAYSRSRAWAAALHKHPDAPDGLRYRSRHNDDQFCIAMFDRAASSVRAFETLPLLHPSTDVVEAINAYGVSVR